MPWGLAVIFTIGGVLALGGLISPNGVRRVTGRLVPQEYRPPDLTSGGARLMRVCSAAILVGIVVFLVLRL